MMEKKYNEKKEVFRIVASFVMLTTAAFIYYAVGVNSYSAPLMVALWVVGIPFGFIGAYRMSIILQSRKQS